MFLVPLVIVWAVVNTVTWVYVCSSTGDCVAVVNTMAWVYVYSSAGDCVGRRQYCDLGVCF